MIKEVQFRNGALSEIKEAYRWYEIQRLGLGEEFLLCIEEAIEKISRNPELYPFVHKHVRRAIVRRFPYGIFYFVKKNKLVIIAIFHVKRNPKKLKKRVNSI
jgi:plasmid stabilization system protein ParE